MVVTPLVLAAAAGAKAAAVGSLLPTHATGSADSIATSFLSHGVSGHDVAAAAAPGAAPPHEYIIHVHSPPSSGPPPLGSEEPQVLNAPGGDSEVMVADRASGLYGAEAKAGPHPSAGTKATAFTSDPAYSGIPGDATEEATQRALNSINPQFGIDMEKLKDLMERSRDALSLGEHRLSELSGQPEVHMSGVGNILGELFAWPLEAMRPYLAEPCGLATRKQKHASHSRSSSKLEEPDDASDFIGSASSSTCFIDSIQGRESRPDPCM
eukprot:CAMPEP_0178402616 /NCGR_PEP_ID=MMETSP0689_2-20121128/16935_1 /TAXON_ID=160604 /ORGANISM="Amphidinium massartii, Strain CS-259" /LENGTH=267 /DNA_ID=CAMNT_0020023525 /DNA_START=1 /DNA_END=804 /DNA_ORIENTATION=-